MVDIHTPPYNRYVIPVHSTEYLGEHPEILEAMKNLLAAVGVETGTEIKDEFYFADPFTEGARAVYADADFSALPIAVAGRVSIAETARSEGSAFSSLAVLMGVIHKQAMLRNGEIKL